MDLKKTDFETAKLLEEIGFGLSFGREISITTTEIIPGYDEDGVLNSMDKDLIYPAPTQELAKKWLRDQFNTEVVVQPMGASNIDKKVYEVFIHGYNKKGGHIDKSGEPIPSLQSFESYEQALEEGLKQACEYLKEK
jgi:hypothetical protein